MKVNNILNSAVLLIFLTGIVTAQEFKSHLTQLEKAINQENYEYAILHMDSMRNKVSNLYGNQLSAKFFPLEIEEFIQIEDNRVNDIGKNTLRIVRTYVNINTLHAVGVAPKDTVSQDDTDMTGNTEPHQLILSVTNATDLQSEISRVHISPPDNIKPGRIYRPVTVTEKYRGLLVYDNNSKFGSLAIIVGAATLQIDGHGIDNTDILIAAAETIRYEELLKEFGY